MFENQIAQLCDLAHVAIDWDNICAMAPPHEPELASPEDTSQFKDPEPRDEPEELYKPARKFEGNQLPFIGFT